MTRTIFDVANDIANLAEEVATIHYDLQTLENSKDRQFFDLAIQRAELVKGRLGNLAIMLGGNSNHANDKIETARLAINRIAPNGMRGHFLYRVGPKSSLDIEMVTGIYASMQVDEFIKWLSDNGWEPIGINDLFMRKL